MKHPPPPDHAQLPPQVRAPPARGQGELPHTEEDHPDLQLPRDTVHRRDGLPEREDHTAQDRPQPLRQGFPRDWRIQE